MTYDKPYVISVPSNLLTNVKTQASGNNGIAPSNPNLICNTFDCDSEGNDVFFNMEWNDDSGSDVNGYTVRLNINGDIYDVKDENATGGSNTCNITESPAGLYTLSCNELQLSGEGCDNCDDYTLVSITDGLGNVFVPNGEVTCETDDC